MKCLRPVKMTVNGVPKLLNQDRSQSLYTTEICKTYNRNM